MLELLRVLAVLEYLLSTSVRSLIWCFFTFLCVQVHGIKRFIHVSTDEVYGEGAADQVRCQPLHIDHFSRSNIPKKTVAVGGLSRVLHTPASHAPSLSPVSLLQEPMFEDQVLEPTNPYAATKAGAEFIAKSYSRSEIQVYALIPSPCHGI